MIKNFKNKKKIYGLELVLEVFDCDFKILTSPKKIKQYLQGISKVVKLDLYGSPKIDRFMGGGFWGKGYSFLQFLTTSSITGHFIEHDRSAFINIFSCKLFDDKKATDFTKKFFKAKKIKDRVLIR